MAAAVEAAGGGGDWCDAGKSEATRRGKSEAIGANEWGDAVREARRGSSGAGPDKSQ